MQRLNPDKLHVRFIPPTTEESPLHPRAYTLTHSDRTADLYLTIGPDYNKKQVRGWYTRLMRDEVLSEWKIDIEGPQLHVYCEVGRGLGSSSFRESIFRRELGLVLEAFRYGDKRLFEVIADLDNARVKVHFIARKSEDSKVEDWGMMKDYA